MKGIIFTTLADMMEAKFGLQLWDEVLQETPLPSGGAYTSGETYNDTELFALLTTLSNWPFSLP